MKKIISSIIFSALFFSSVFSVNANGVLWDILEFDTGIESFRLENIPELPERSFTNSSQQSTYNNLRIIDAALREEFIKQYSEWQIEYYQMQDLIDAYKNFLYYTDKTFDYISEYEKNSRSSEIQNAIILSYSQMKNYYIKVQNIIE